MTPRQQSGTLHGHSGRWCGVLWLWLRWAGRAGEDGVWSVEKLCGRVPAEVGGRTANGGGASARL